MPRTTLTEFQDPSFLFDPFAILFVTTRALASHSLGQSTGSGAGRCGRPVPGRRIVLRPFASGASNRAAPYDIARNPSCLAVQACRTYRTVRSP